MPAVSLFTQEKGRLLWPTSGTLIHHFGAPIESSELRYNGVLINATIGSQVHAIYSGRVVFSGALKGLGLLIIIDHGDGYLSLYGHNKALYKRIGSTVNRGETIASVGNTDAIDDKPGLYFEIRYNSRPLNPEQWCH